MIDNVTKDEIVRFTNRCFNINITRNQLEFYDYDLQGDCYFSALKHVLYQFGIHTSEKELRESFATYFMDGAQLGGSTTDEDILEIKNYIYHFKEDVENIRDQPNVHIPYLRNYPNNRDIDIIDNYVQYIRDPENGSPDSEREYDQLINDIADYINSPYHYASGADINYFSEQYNLYHYIISRNEGERGNISVRCDTIVPQEEDTNKKYIVLYHSFNHFKLININNLYSYGPLTDNIRDGFICMSEL